MAYSLVWMPQVLLDAKLKVSLVDGWEDRGVGEMGPVQGVICHHTAGSRQGNMPTLRTLIDGRPDLKGPLAQLGLGRDGTFYVLAAGRANHAGKGTWRGAVNGNGSFIGIEAENTGLANDQPWPEVQMDAFARGVAALFARLELPAEACAGHKEWALPRGRKIDPTFDMVRFRAQVAAILSGQAPPPRVVPPVEPAPKPGKPARATLRRGAEGPLVTEVQKAVGASVDGKFGPGTEAKVREWQRAHALVPDGIFGPASWAKVDALRSAGGSVRPPP